jgi:hypothetical protein
MTVHLLRMQTTWNATVKSHSITPSPLGLDPPVPTSMTQSVMGLNTDRSLEEDISAAGTRFDITIWISLLPRMAFTMPCQFGGLEVLVDLLPAHHLISRCGIEFSA